MKTCKFCLESKPLTAFGVDRGTKDGYRSLCKACRKIEGQARKEELASRPKPTCKVCTGCKEEKALGEFHNDSRGLGGKSATCKVCRRKRQAAYRNANLEKVRASKRSSRFGLTDVGYKELLEQQGGVCAICKTAERAMLHGKTKHLSVDHCHTTNKVRGLLCSTCNTALGKFRDSPDLLRSAIKYLEVHQ